MAARRFLTSLSLVLASCVAFGPWCGCGPVYENPAPQVDGQYLVHVVRSPEETVGKLALWYTGSSKSIDAIKAANPAISSGSLRVGRRVRIPLELAVQTAPPAVVAATPTPVKLVVVPERAVASAGSARSPGRAGQEEPAVDLDDLDKFDEEVGPSEERDSDSMNLRMPTSTNSNSVVAADSAPDTALSAPSASSIGRVLPQEADSRSRSDVDRFESQAEQLLMKEQAEIDELQRELSAARPDALSGQRLKK